MNQVSTRRKSRSLAAVVAVAALVMCGCVGYWPILQNGFVFFDDHAYIYENPHIANGLTWETLLWAFNAGYAANWHPLTWISHALDVTLFGLNPQGHHVVNVLLHLANTLLLFAFLRFSTARTWKSAFVAGLFALHPLHVESVAWASERKDVLSTFFFMLALLTYSAYAASPNRARYALVVLLTVLGLMAKPMLVSMPLVLLILDYWPLKRSLPLKRLVAEKLPLVALSAGSCVLTLLAQQNAVVDLERIPLILRLGNALLSYVVYLWNMVWPTGLAIQYAYASPIPVWKIVGAAGFLASVTAAAILVRRRSPFLLAGWLWYVVTLVPVIGIVQVGSQSMADRYTYIPLVGVFTAAVWGTGAAFAGLRLSRRVVAAFCTVAAVLVIAVLVLMTQRQVRFWRDSVTLFEHAVSVSPKSPLPHSNLVTVWVRQGNLDKAEYHARRVVAIEPRGAKGLAKLAWVLYLQQRFAEAESAARAAVEVDPAYAPGYLQLGDILDASGDLAGAKGAYLKALTLRPEYLEARANLAAVLLKLGNVDEAIRHCNAALRLNPQLPQVHGTISVALALKGRYRDALEHARQCEELGLDLPDSIVDQIFRLAESER